MKKILASLLFIGFSIVTFAQTDGPERKYFEEYFSPLEIESEPFQWKDTTEVNLLNRQAEHAFEAEEYDKALELVDKAMHISNRLEYTHGVVSCSILKAKIKQEREQYAEALDCYLSARVGMRTIGDLKAISDVNYEIGLLHKDWGVHIKALDYHLAAYDLKSEIGDIEGNINVLYEIGHSYLILKENTNAIEYFQKLLELQREINASELDILSVLRRISDTYQKQNQYEEALKYDKEIVEIRKQINDTIGVANSLNNLGYLHKYLGDYELALARFKEALEKTKKYSPPNHRTSSEKTILINIGIIYNLQKEYKKSNEYFYNALSISVTSGKSEEIADIYMKIAENHIAMGDLVNARRMVGQAISLTDGSDNQEFRAKSYKKQSEIYEKLGDDKNALIYYRNFAEVQEKIIAEQRESDAELLQKQNLIDRAENDRKLVEAEQEMQALRYAKLELDKNSKERENQFLKQEQELQAITLANEQAAKEKAKQDLQIQQQRWESERKDIEIRELQQQDSIKELRLEKLRILEKQQEDAHELLKEKAKIQELQLEEQKIQERIFYGVIGFLAVIIFLVLRSYFIKRKAHKILTQRNLEIQLQKDKLEQSYNNVKQLSEIAKSITSNLSVERIIETVYQNVSTLMDATMFGVGLYNSQTRSIEFPGLKEKGETIILISYKIKEKDRLAVWCYENKQSIFISDFENEYQNYVSKKLPSVTGDNAASIIYLPLIVKNKAIGVISVQSFKKNAYTEYHLNILRNLAVHTAIALENAANYGQIKDKTVKLEKTLKDLKATQAQLVQSEKMASLGQLTAGIAHEINNPINFVYAGIDGLRASVEVLMEILNKYEEIEDFTGIEKVLDTLNEIHQLKSDLYFNETKSSINDLISAIKDGAQRTAEIVDGLRNFSRTNETELKTVNIHKGIESSLVLLNNKINEHDIRIIKKFDEELPEINCYPGQLNQVFMNLLSNAIEAIDQKGRIEIKTENLENDIKISIMDNGCGMSEAIIEKIFDPFFTTKDLGKGTGLGLAISFGIIKKHKGKFDIVSKEGKGSTFIIYIPKGLESQSSEQRITSEMEA
ncbi:tetratricopeptide repeat protein [Fulvivirgaceae bacterium BMA10]|uniref:histidine kinase n=1 Tax=Splendidivirga corallicola TaxID=3051826 RepID=A0ABT8KLX5_9BACT|nr:tetratricopeptide repeat protein [Fulvivirgaceae bacterium BMA10]